MGRRARRRRRPPCGGSLGTQRIPATRKDRVEATKKTPYPGRSASSASKQAPTASVSATERQNQVRGLGDDGFGATGSSCCAIDSSVPARIVPPLSAGGARAGSVTAL